MKRQTFIIFFSLIYIPCKAQLVKILDKSSLDPVERVFIYNVDSTVSAEANKDGLTDLSPFDRTDTLIFQHSSYHPVSIAMYELEKQAHTVFLTGKIIEMDGVVISANRWEQEKRRAPNAVRNISPDEIHHKTPQTMADALYHSGGVFLQKSQMGGGSPMIRGFAANSLLITIDGVRMNNAIFRSGNLQNVILIDPNALDGAEIIYGPGAVMYGSDALGGTMSFYTRQPDYADGGSAFNGHALTRYATANGEKTGHLQFKLAGRKVAGFTSLTCSDFNDLRTGNNRDDRFPDFGKRLYYVRRINGSDSVVANDDYNMQRYSGYSQLNLTQKIRYAASDNLDLTYGFLFTTGSNVPRYDRLIEQDDNGRPVYAQWYYGPQKWMMQYMTADLRKSRYFSAGKVTTAYQRVKESRHSRRFQSESLRSQIEQVDVFSLNADFQQVFAGDKKLFYGGEAIYNRVNSQALEKNILTAEENPASTRYPAGGSDYYMAAPYVSYQFNAGKEWSFNAGLRYTRTWLSARGGEFSSLSFDQLQTSHGSLNGALGVVFTPSVDVKYSAIVSTGFRSPNLDDVGKIFDFTDDYVVVPNPQLKSERLYNFELGLEKSFDKIVSLQISGFYALLDNAIERRDFTYRGVDSIFYNGSYKKTQAMTNTGLALITGADVKLIADIGQALSLVSGATFTHGRDIDDDIPLRHSAPVFGRTSAILKLKKFRGELAFRFNGPKKASNMPPSELAKPHLYTPAGSLAWQTLNLYLAYQLNDWLNLQLNLENIADVHYRPYSSGISAAGRNIVLSVKTDF